MATDATLIRDALNSTGGTEGFAKKFQQYSASVSFIDDNRKELLSKYDGNWVAVYNSNVVAHAKEYEELVDKIERKGLPIGELAIKFISSRKVMTLF